MNLLDLPTTDAKMDEELAKMLNEGDNKASSSTATPSASSLDLLAELSSKAPTGRLQARAVMPAPSQPQQHAAYIHECAQLFNSRQITQEQFVARLKTRMGAVEFQRFMAAQAAQRQQSMVPPPSRTQTRIASTNASHNPPTSRHLSLANVASSRQTPILSAPTTSLAKSTADVLDTSALQDVMQYAGVDLKEESEMIIRQAESSSRSSHHSHPSEHYTDETRKQDFVSPLATLQSLVRTLVKASGLNNVDSDVELYLAMALQERTRQVLEQAIRASKARMEVARDSWELELVDGESAYAPSGGRSRVGAVKRSLVWLERLEKHKEIELAKEWGMSLSEEGRMALEEIAAETAPADGDDDEQGGGKSKKIKRNAEDDRDEMAVRTRLANAVALRAAGDSGGPKYSWMEAAAAGSSRSALPTLPSETQQGNAAFPGMRTAKQAGGFSLPRPAMRKKALASRTVTLTDVVFAMRHDRSKGGRWSKMRRTPLARRCA